MLVLQLSNRYGSDNGGVLVIFMIFITVTIHTSSSAIPAFHHVFKSFIQVQRVSTHEGREIPGIGLGSIAEIRHVEDASPAASGEENLLFIGRIAFGEEALDKHEGFEGDGPVAGLVEAFGEGFDTGADVGTRVGG